MTLLLDEDNKQTLRAHINKAWLKKEVSEKWKEGFVVSIYKKGDSKDPAYYRPISLLSTAYYETNASKNSNSKGLPNLKQTMGFHKTDQQEPQYILRRVQEIFEASTSPLYLLFLDWKQAFDKLTHPGNHHALKRFGILKANLDMIDNRYQNPTLQAENQSNINKAQELDKDALYRFTYS